MTAIEITVTPLQDLPPIPALPMWRDLAISAARTALHEEGEVWAKTFVLTPNALIVFHLNNALENPDAKDMLAAWMTTTLKHISAVAMVTVLEAWSSKNPNINGASADPDRGEELTIIFETPTISQVYHCNITRDAAGVPTAAEPKTPVASPRGRFVHWLCPEEPSDESTLN